MTENRTERADPNPIAKQMRRAAPTSKSFAGSRRIRRQPSLFPETCRFYQTARLAAHRDPPNYGGHNTAATRPEDGGPAQLIRVP
jgi:hypothetical protein